MHKPVPLTLPPGIVRTDSSFATKGRYYDATMVRFFKGKPQRWGGWVQQSLPTLPEPPRAALAWTANDQTKIIAVATTNFLFLISDNTLYDITPSGLTTLTEGVPWSLHQWGEDLVAVRRGYGFYHWQRSLGFGSFATAVPGAPLTSLGVFVGEDRHAVLMGAHDGTKDDPLRLQWPNQETLDDWVNDATKTSGNIRVEAGNQIMGAIPIQGGHLVLTDVSAYNWRYIGGGFVFSRERVAGGRGMIAPSAGVEVDGNAYWMSQDSFARYDGTAGILDCDVEEYVFTGLNRSQASRVFCSTNTAFNEIVWYYPDGVNTECNRYVTYNYLDSSWTIGTLARSFWIDKGSASTKPIAGNATGSIFTHETGTVDENGSEVAYFLHSGQIEVDTAQSISAVQNVIEMRKIVPDYARITGTHQLEIVGREYPNDAGVTKGPYTFNTTTKAYHPRVSGATLQLKFSGSGDFRMGDVKGFIAGSRGRG